MKLFLGIGVVVLFLLVGAFSWFQTLWNNPSDIINATDTMIESWTPDNAENGEDMSGAFVPTSGTTARDSADTALPSETTGSYTTLPTSEAPMSATADTAITADWLTPEQRAQLEWFGIDPSDIPTTLTPALEECFVEAIGALRVSAIKAGDSPSFMEMTKAVSCL